MHRNLGRVLLRGRAGRSLRYSSTVSESTSRPSASLRTAPSTRYTTVSHPEDASSVPASVKALLDRANAYVLPVYARPPFILSHGKGAYVWDTQGRKYLDFSAGIAVNAFGHGDEGLAEVMATEAKKLLHTSNAFHHQWSPKLAELLVTLTQQEGGLGWETGTPLNPPNGTTTTHGAKVFFSNSGTEANEGALKIARFVGKERWAAKTSGKTWDDPSCDKYELVCFEHAFHGRSMGSLSVTMNPKYQKPFEPLLPGVKVGKLNVSEDLDKLVTEKTAAVILEPIQGEGGINVADIDWLRKLRKRCDETGAVLIFDEIQCGLFRTGTLWAHSAYPVDCHPDVITMAKPLANGYPIGAVLLRDSIAEPMTAACALGHYVLSRLSERAFVRHIEETSGYLEERLSLLPQWFPDVLLPSIRGRGFIRGLGFKNVAHPGRLVEMARERGVLILSAGKDAVRLVPSLNVGREEVDLAVDVLESCLANIASES
ncbi:unnamed protein product [Somion occarium]|uniref:Acetylornithine transaminase n=1 Tax=Somion occarium TaxID=3059160 RepID=A0ABP1D197_9APHY